MVLDALSKLERQVNNICGLPRCPEAWLTTVRLQRCSRGQLLTRYDLTSLATESNQQHIRDTLSPICDSWLTLMFSHPRLCWQGVWHGSNPSSAEVRTQTVATTPSRRSWRSAAAGLAVCRAQAEAFRMRWHALRFFTRSLLQLKTSSKRDRNGRFANQHASPKALTSIGSHHKARIASANRQS